MHIKPALAILPLVFAPLTFAQSYPSKPIRFLVGFPPGGTNDIVARALAQKLTENVGQSFVVENRGGANTAIATEVAARAAPDGYTILLNAPGHATNPALMKLAFDSIKDFAFISLVAEAQNLVVVHPSFPPRSVQKMIAEPSGDHAGPMTPPEPNLTCTTCPSVPSGRTSPRSRLCVP